MLLILTNSQVNVVKLPLTLYAHFQIPTYHAGTRTDYIQRYPGDLVYSIQKESSFTMSVSPSVRHAESVLRSAKIKRADSELKKLEVTPLFVVSQIRIGIYNGGFPATPKIDFRMVT